MFRGSKDKSMSSAAGLRAYRIIAFAYTLVLTVVGGSLFLNPAAWPTNPATAMLAPHGSVRFLGAVLFGELLMWDIPCSLFINKLRRPDLVLHHVFLLGPAAIAMTFNPVFYYVWFLGLSEASSVWLAGNDYYAELHDAVAEEDADSPRLPGLAKLRDGCQIGAAAFFVLVRVLGWGGMVWILFRDTLAVLPLAASVGMRGFLKAQLLFAGAFYGLQLLWFKKLVAYTLSSGLGGAQPVDEDGR